MATHRDFNFKNFAGSYQLALESAKDLRAIDLLDEPFWVATSAPTRNFKFDNELLRFLDADDDKRILSNDIRRTYRWMATRLANLDGVTEASEALELAHLAGTSPEGQALLTASKRILYNLGDPDATRITLVQVRDHKAIYARSIHNGDGVIPPTGLEDPGLQGFAQDILTTMGGVLDLSGLMGVNLEKLEAFMQQSRALLAWMQQAKVENPALDLFPLDAETATGYAALSAIRHKVDSYFTRCRVAALNESLARPTPEPPCAPEDMANSAAIAAYMEAAPLARPRPGGTLPLVRGVNPAFADRLRVLATTVLAPLLPDRAAPDQLTEAEWTRVKNAFQAYEGWQNAKAGGEVEKLGPDKLRAYLDGPFEEQLRSFIASDLAVGKELAAVRDLEILILMQRCFLDVCNNFISFPYLYDPEKRAVFECGRLVMDGRIFNFNVKVDDIAAHSKMAASSGIYLMYSEVSGPLPEDKFNIVTPVTAYTLGTLGVDKRGVLFTLDGRERDVRVVKIVENPISLRHAISKPFKRLGELFTGTLEKLTASTEKQLDANITKTTQTLETGVTQTMDQSMKAPPPVTDPAAAAAAKPDPAKPADQNGMKQMMFNGTIAFAALGSSMAYITKTLSSLNPQIILVAIIVGLALILVPTVLIADYKLSRRNLSGLLEASGWAINSPMYLTRSMARLLAPKPIRPAIFGKLRRDITRGFVQTVEKRKKHFLIGTPALLILLVGLAWGGYAWHRHQRQALIDALYKPAPKGMVLIPAGSFIRGSNEPGAEADEKPQRTEFLPAYYIDIHEVTNEDYWRYDPGHDFRPHEAKLPVTGIYKEQAEDYARWAGKRLPTDAEWEKAARGTDGRRYPWGDDFDPALANVRPLGQSGSKLKRVGSYPDGASPYGVMDMAGNAWEWVSDPWVVRERWWEHLYHPEPQLRGIIRGGGHSYGPLQSRTTYHGFEGLNATCNDVGFRCAMDAIPLDPTATTPSKPKRKAPDGTDDSGSDASVPPASSVAPEPTPNAE